MFRRLSKALFLTRTHDIRRARKAPVLRAEWLEDRSVPTASFRPDQVLIQFQPGVDEAARAGARAVIGGQLVDAVDIGDSAPELLETVTLPAGVTVADAVQALQFLPVVRFAEPNWILSGQSLDAPTDPYYSGGSLWGMAGDNGTPSNRYGSQAAEAWATGAVGSRGVYVAVIDEGIDYRHPDLYQNIFINRAEIPFFVSINSLDLDRDGQLSYRELNDPANAALLPTAGRIRDLNANGYVDAQDVLNPVALGGWADGRDGDGNGRIDDLAGWDFAGNDKVTYDGGTGDDHGTHVAGTIGAAGDNGLGVAGVNWAVSIIPVKFLGADGGATSNAVRGIDYVTDLKLRQGLNVVATNNSWGGGSYSRALHEAILRSARADILFIAAAGNDGDEAGSGDNDFAPHYPASYDSTVGTAGMAGAGYDNVISVAAVTRSGGLATFSNYGVRSVDIAAPGQTIYSTLPGGRYGAYSGTSMATPHVTGAAALYAATHPGATARDIRHALLSSAVPTDSFRGLTVTGGRLDVAAALLVPVTPPVGGPTGPLVRLTPASPGPGRTLAVGGSTNGSAVVYAPDPTGLYGLATSRIAPFAGFTGDVRTATADVDGDGIEDTILVTGPGGPLRVAVVSGADDTTLLVTPFDPFGGDFVGGGFVAAADLDGTGGAEFVITPDRGGGPRVTVFSLVDGAAVVRVNFFGVDDPGFRGGARAAVGDVNGDRTADLVVAAGFGGGPRVAVFDGRTALSGTPAKLVGDFFAFDDVLRNGVYVAVGDVDYDGFGDLIFGAGPGGGPRVMAVSGKTLLGRGAAAAADTPLANFFVAGNTSDRGGVRVAAKDADGDGRADLVVGSGEGSASRVRVYLGKDFTTGGEPTTFQDLDPFARVLADGVFVG